MAGCKLSWGVDGYGYRHYVCDDCNIYHGKLSNRMAQNTQYLIDAGAVCSDLGLPIIHGKVVEVIKCVCKIPVVVDNKCVNCGNEPPHVALCNCHCVVPTYPLFRLNKHVDGCKYEDKEND